MCYHCYINLCEYLIDYYSKWQPNCKSCLDIKREFVKLSILATNLKDTSTMTEFADKCKTIRNQLHIILETAEKSCDGMYVDVADDLKTVANLIKGIETDNKIVFMKFQESKSNWNVV